MSASQAKSHADDAYEICVSCGRQTDVLRDTPIDKREYYIHGYGQLCGDCCRMLTQTENEMTDEEMEHLVKSIRL